MNKTALLIPAGVIVAVIGLVGSTGRYSGATPGAVAPIVPSPHTSVLASVQAARDNDLSALMSSVFTHGELAEMSAEWNVERAREIDPGEELVFQVTMSSMTAEGAEAALMAKVEPELDEIRPQTAMVAAMLAGLAQAKIDSTDGVDAEQAEKASRVLGELTELITNADFTDPIKAREVVDIVCRTARSLELESLSELHALDFDQLVAKGDGVLAGLKDALSIYGISVDEWLDSVRAETVRESDDRAWVRVSFELLGSSEDTEVEMHLVDGRWAPVRPEDDEQDDTCAVPGS